MEISKTLAATLHQFNAASLADGNVIAGANVLAVMCCSIANILPRGAGFKDPTGDILPVSTDLLLLDGLSRALADSKIFAQMTDLQSALTANIHEANAYEAYHGVGRTVYGKAIEAPPSPDIPLVHLQNALNGFSARQGDSSPFEMLLTPSTRKMNSHIKKNPLVFTRVDAASLSLGQLASAHLGQLLVRASLDGRPRRARFISQLESAMQSGIENVALHARVVLSAPPETFRGLFAAGDSDFLSRFLWIYDHSPSTARSPIASNGFSPGQAFEAALRRAWARRLDFRRSPPIIRFEWKELQHRWLAFLGQQEYRFQGISATAYPLFATLLTGLFWLAGDASRSVKASGAFEMAKFLVTRAVSLREHLARTEERARLLKIAEKMVTKFDGHAYTARELVRKFNRLPMADCQDVLQLLSQERIVIEASSGQWKLTVPVSDGLEKIKASTIDI